MEFTTINAVWTFFLFFLNKRVKKNQTNNKTKQPPQKTKPKKPCKPKLQKERGSSSGSREGIFLEVCSGNLWKSFSAPAPCVPLSGRSVLPAEAAGPGPALGDGARPRGWSPARRGLCGRSRRPSPAGAAPRARSGAAGACGPAGPGGGGRRAGPCRGPAWGEPCPARPGVVPAAPPGAPEGAAGARPGTSRGGLPRPRAAAVGSRLSFRAFQGTVTMNERFAWFYKETAAFFFSFLPPSCMPVCEWSSAVCGK